MPLHLIFEADRNALITHCRHCNAKLSDAFYNQENNATWSEATYDSSPRACNRYQVALIETVNHPNHYGGADNVYEAIKIIEALGLDFCVGNAIKYIVRAGKKDQSREIEDLKKAVWYLERKIGHLSK